MDTFELNKEKFYAYRNLRQDMQGQFFLAMPLFPPKKPEQRTSKAHWAFEWGCVQGGMARPGARNKAAEIK